jgi:hypothetical protein
MLVFGRRVFGSSYVLRVKLTSGVDLLIKEITESSSALPAM